MAQRDFDEIYKVGVQDIDDQHRALARMIDTLYAMDDLKVDAEAISDIMAGIGQLTRDHFDAEEKILAQLGAPADEIAAHKSDHTRLLHEYMALVVKSIAGKPPVPSELSSFLEHWLTDHIFNHDLKIRRYFPRWRADQGEA